MDSVSGKNSVSNHFKEVKYPYEVHFVNDFVEDDFDRKAEFFVKILE